MRCVRCGSETTRRDGQTRLGGQRWRCTACCRRCTARSTSAFSHHSFPDDVIALGVRWYVRYRLSYADVVEWFAERGLGVDRRLHLSLGAPLPPTFSASGPGPSPTSRREVAGGRNLRAPQRDVDLHVPRDRPARPGGRCLFLSATQCQSRGSFKRAINETGRTPTRVTTDKAKCYPPALRAVLPNVEHRRTRYLNNGLERDHGHMKQRFHPMRGFKQPAAADILARGHALIQNLRNGFSTLTSSTPRLLRLATAWSQLAQAI